MMTNALPDRADASLGPATPCSPGRRRSPVAVALASLAAAFVVLPACNAVLGIDDATLCGDGSCDGGAPAFSEQVAPNLPGNGADAGVNGPSPGSESELIPPLQGVNGSDGAGSGGTGAGVDAPAQPEEGGGSGGGDTGNSGPGNPGSGNSGSGNSNGNSGSGNNGNGNSGSGNSGPGGGGGEVPPPASPCDGRASGSAFCDGATRISCGPGGSVAGTLPCPSIAHCTQSTGPACAACLTGEASCTGAILSVCNAAHSGFDTSACAGPAQCNAAQARCDAAPCSANELRCDGAVLQVCNATLTGFEPVVDCGSPAACNAQTGACNICTPGTRRCVDSGTVGICDSTGQTETRIDCTPLLESCAAGECELLGL